MKREEKWKREKEMNKDEKRKEIFLKVMTEIYKKEGTKGMMKFAKERLKTDNSSEIFDLALSLREEKGRKEETKESTTIQRRRGIYY